MTDRQKVEQPRDHAGGAATWGGSQSALTAGVLLGGAGLFTIDLFVPLGIAIWLPYVGVVLLSLWFPRRWQTYATAAFCTILMAAGLWLSLVGEWPFWMSMLNRALGIAAVWTVAVVGLAARRTYQLEQANERLQREIAERQRLQAQLLRTQRLDSIGVLASGIAHDFNNLLTPMLMAARLLMEERPEEERRRLLQTLLASGERASEVIQQLLSFAGGADGQRAPVQVGGVLREVVSILDHTFPRALRIESRVRPDLPPVLGSATQLAQVVMNLCVNARDAMPRGGTLTVGAEVVSLARGDTPLPPGGQPGRYAVIRVADTGCGIAPDVIDRVFDPFFTTKGPGKGTGLGLSTALGIVKSHGGFIDVASEPGRGSRFAAYLPVAEGASAPPSTPPAEEAPEGRGELILVVDDEASILDTVGLTLKRHGYRVVTAPGGPEAVAAYATRRGEVRAVILDMMMPGMDGAATLGALRRLDTGVRVITSSGLRARGELADMVAAGAVGFLPKPYSDAQLLATLAQALRKS